MREVGREREWHCEREEDGRSGAERLLLPHSDDDEVEEEERKDSRLRSRIPPRFYFGERREAEEDECRVANTPISMLLALLSSNEMDHTCKVK